jgi:hypothetical protein
LSRTENVPVARLKEFRLETIIVFMPPVVIACARTEIEVYTASENCNSTFGWGALFPSTRTVSCYKKSQTFVKIQLYRK